MPAKPAMLARAVGPWALQFRDLIAHGPTALASMAGFAGILLVAYVYALKKGALNWKA